LELPPIKKKELIFAAYRDEISHHKEDALRSLSWMVAFKDIDAL